MNANLITVAEAARLADRSKTVVRRWITEGFVPLAYTVPGRNGPWLVDEDQFKQDLPSILTLMEERKGGRGNKAPDAWGNDRSRTQEA